MRISVAADSLDGVAEQVVAELRRRGHEVVTHGALTAGERDDRASACEAAARRWNDANVLALSLRLTSEIVLVEILDAWLAGEASTDGTDCANIEHIARL